MNSLDYIQLTLFTIMIFSAVLWFLVYLRNRDEVHTTQEATRLHEVTFLVPAYNEEKHIEGTIDAIKNLDYPEDQVEIIAIDDGSTDATGSILESYDDITVLSQDNQGKAAALNNGLQHVETDLVACMDADSKPAPDFLDNMVGYMEKDNVAGVTPALKLSRHETLAEKIQWVEYMFQIFLRKVFAIFDVQYVLPGPGSIYKTSYVKETGGWDNSTLTEDMEIAFRMVDDGKDIENSANAYTYTSPPSSFLDLVNQRIRWYTGYINNFLDYSHLLGSARYGNMGVFLLPLNLVWIGISLFFLGLISYNAGDILITNARTYLLLGYVPMKFGFGLLDLQLFHVFFAFFLVTSAATIMISLKTASEPFDAANKKMHYAGFLTIYSIIFAYFWLATLYNMATGERQW